ncbi:alpha/beta hydrolase [Pontibacter locisalis]|uniref:Alpha/beta hydrolase n=1 Tax=Pontibacter locisalis TaxID=1719035 RepID=A0ABW5IF83_9BACT
MALLIRTFYSRPEFLRIEQVGKRIRDRMTVARDKDKTGRLTAKQSSKTTKREVATGVRPLRLDDQENGYLYVPVNYNRLTSAALAVMFHGAGATAEQGLSLIRRYADDNNILIMAPASHAQSWDIIVDHNFGIDVSLLDQALAHVFEEFVIDSKHIGIGGFSDGASYALSLGLTNGDLFTHIIAFSPGFAYTVEKRGIPAVFMSHGIDDPVLPIDPCGRRIAPLLREQGLALEFKEFKGGHEIPDDISASAVHWFLKAA